MILEQTSSVRAPVDVPAPMQGGAPAEAPQAKAVMGVPSSPDQGTAAQRGCNSREAWFNIGFLVLMFVLFYFLLIRPQQKQQKEREAMLASLRKGDRVVTSGGIIGTITSITDDVLTIEIADRVRVKVLKSAVVRRMESDDGKKSTNSKEK